MKLLFVFLSIAILFSCTKAEREPDSFREYLLQKEFITQEEEKRVDTADYISSLYQIYEGRMSPMQRNFPRQVIMTKKTERLIQSFYRYGIIEKETQDEMLALVLSPTDPSGNFKQVIIDEYHVLTYLTEREVYTRTKTPDTLRAYIQKLHDTGLLNEDALSLKSYQSTAELLPFIEKKLIFTPKHIPASPEGAYGHFFQKIERLDSNLHIEDFVFETIEKTNGDETSSYAHITFSWQGKSFTNARIILRENDYTFTYLQLLNQLFNAQNSEYRAISLENISEDKLLFVLLTKQQHESLRESKSERYPLYFSPDWYKFSYGAWPRDYLSPEEIEKHFKEYDALGEFSHLSQQQKSDELKILKGSEISSPEAILFSVNKIF